LALEKIDQETAKSAPAILSKIKNKSRFLNQSKNIYSQFHVRANRMLEILDIIKLPSIENIGADGCGALLLLAQHSYIGCMQKVLSAIEESLVADPDSFPVENIPSLIDRIMVIKKRKQKFGTQWSISENGKMETAYLIPVEDFKNMNKRRKKYGLGPAMKVTDLAYGAEKYPLGKGRAEESNQREMTNNEHRIYSRYFHKSLV